MQLGKSPRLSEKAAKLNHTLILSLILLRENDQIKRRIIRINQRVDVITLMRRSDTTAPPTRVRVCLLQEVLGEEGGPLLGHLHDLVLGRVEGVLRLLALVEDNHLLKIWGNPNVRKGCENPKCSLLRYSCNFPVSKH